MKVNLFNYIALTKSVGGATGETAMVELCKSDNNTFEVAEYIADEDMDFDGTLIKKGEELRYILGIVLEPEVVDGTVTEKTRGDIYSAEEIRKAAHYFMTRYRGQGHDIMHSDVDIDSLKIVESFIAPQDLTINGKSVKKGSWLIGSLIFDDKVWAAIKMGKLTGYSVGGRTDGVIE